MTPRCLLVPRVIPSPDPAMVVTKTPTESPEIFYETKLTPIEARRLGLALLIDADRADRHAETIRWLADRNMRDPV